MYITCMDVCVFECVAHRPSGAYTPKNTHTHMHVLTIICKHAQEKSIRNWFIMTQNTIQQAIHNGPSVIVTCAIKPCTNRFKWSHIQIAQGGECLVQCLDSSRPFLGTIHWSTMTPVSVWYNNTIQYNILYLQSRTLWGQTINNSIYRIFLLEITM